MIRNLKINHLSIKNGPRIFFNKDFNINSEISNIERSVVRKDYWYKKQEHVIAPKTLLFQGSFASGKTSVFKLLEIIRNIVIENSIESDILQEFDVEIEFFCSECHFYYHIIFNDNEIADLLFCNGKTVTESKGETISISEEICPEAYAWFNNLIFIPSLYDDSEKYREEISKHSQGSLNDILYYHKQRFQHKTDYSIKIENIIASDSNLSFMNTFFSNNNILRTPLKEINQSTLDLLYAIQLICYFSRLEDGVLIIDDIDVIAKTRFMEFVNDHFVSEPAYNPIQLIAFSNRICSTYENRQLFMAAHRINLDSIV